MVSASPQLIAFLQAGYPFYGADLFTVTLLDGTVITFTSFDRPIYYGGVTYVPWGPYAKRSSIKLSVGLQASTMDLNLICPPTIQVEGTAVLLSIAQGRWSNAAVSVRRAFMTQGDLTAYTGVATFPTAICNLTGAPTGQGDGTILRFAGNVGTIEEVTAVSAKIEVRDYLFLLNRPCPKNVYMPTCWHTLFDFGCTLNAAAYAVSSAVQTGSTVVTVNTNLTQDANQPAAPTANVALTAVATPNNVKTLPWTPYWVVVTYVGAYGETTASPESSLGCNPGFVAQVASPPAEAGAIGWNVYIGDYSGNEQLQNTSGPLTIGVPFISPYEGYSFSGVIPPQIATTGYFSFGRIEFTSGVNKGLTASVSASNSSGQLSIVAPLLQAPNTGDTFIVYPGCDKTLPTCQYKFNNLVNFAGQPGIPTPEQATG